MPFRTIRALATLVSILLAVALRPQGTLAQTQQIVRGRVVSNARAAIASATVLVTPAGGAAQTTTTASDGTYAASVPVASSYEIAVSAAGFATQRRVVNRPSTAGADSAIVADFTMAPAAATPLPGVRSVAARPRAARSDALSDISIGGQVSFIDVASALSGDVTGDLTSALAFSSAVQLTPGTDGRPTVSLYGVPGDQNTTVLNGLDFSGNVPRDGFRVSLVSSAYDAARGGFAGGQTSLRMASGANLVARSLHATYDEPATQWTTPAARALGGRFTQGVVSGQASGPVEQDRVFYSTAYQFSNRLSNEPSLFADDPATLRAWNASPDSVGRLLSAALKAGIPIHDAATDQRETTEGRLAARIDYSPNPSPTPSLTSPITALSDDYFVEFGGSWRRSSGLGTTPTALPSAAVTRSHADGWIQGTMAKYVFGGLLGENSLALNFSGDHARPSVTLPAARVLVASASDSQQVAGLYDVGGSTADRGDLVATSAQWRSLLTRMTWDRHNTTTGSFEASIDHISLTQQPAPGQFVFNSIHDLEQNTPVSFSRTIGGTTAGASGYGFAASLGDQYQPSGVFRVQYGVRVEESGLLSHAPFNAGIDSLFGRRTDRAPHSFAVLPMAGFTWQTLGYIPVPEINNAVTRGFVTGGIRRYRGSYSSRSLADDIRQSGVAGTLIQVFCSDSTTPVPTWAQYAASTSNVPTSCVQGAAPTLGQVAPTVSTLADDFSPVTSWRANLNGFYRPSKSIQLSLAETYAINHAIPGIVDLNLRTSPSFALGSEAGRPIYVGAASIAPQSGIVSWTGSRQSLEFAHVTENRSSLNGRLSALTLGVAYSPLVTALTSSSYTIASINYTLTTGHDETFGFTGTTAGNPMERESSTTALPRHTLILVLSRRQDRVGTVALSARAQSGYRYTPIVAGDVNGDGYANDRAFVFDPSATSDTTYVSGLSRMIANAPRDAADCLRAQLGRIASRNSCVAPWAIPLLNLTVSPDPYTLHMGNRAQVTFNVFNILSGLDQAFHGSNNLRGWGQWAAPDPVLLTPRGYDATRSRFMYSVNPLFGRSTVYRTVNRVPFSLGLDVRLELGPDREAQILASSLRPRVGERGDSLSADAIKGRLDRAQNPLTTFSAQLHDSLGLTTAQVQGIRALANRYAESRDFIVTQLARFLSAQHGAYGGPEVRDRYHYAAVEITKAGVRIAKQVNDLLTPEQRAKMRKYASANQVNAWIALDPDRVEYTLRGPVTSLP